MLVEPVFDTAPRSLGRFVEMGQNVVVPICSGLLR